MTDEQGPFVPSKEQIAEHRRKQIANRIILGLMALVLAGMVYGVINHYYG